MNRISFLSLCALVLGTTASPVELITPSQQAAIQAKCRDISHTLLPDPTCWNTLDMDGWLKEWNRPGVTTECKPGEAWANCFMRLTNPNIPDIDCTTMKSKTCPEPKPAEIVPGPAEIYYGAWSIWFFTQYLNETYKWIPTGSASAIMGVEEVVKIFNDGTPPYTGQPPYPTDPFGKAVARKFATLFQATADSIWGFCGATAQGPLKRMLADTLTNFDSGAFLTLAKDGGLLHPAVKGEAGTWADQDYFDDEC
ncbi:MAG: hypothetical protein Q9178_001763 [Gyalolechia marmorata]